MIDLVGMMFEYMLNDDAIPSIAKAELSRLHTSHLKVAIIDKGELIENTSTRKLLNSLKKETFVLDLEAPLAELPQLKTHKLKRVDDQTVEADICRDDSINTLFTELNAHGIKVLSMRNKTNRLEELFMNLVENANGNGATT